ncbi:MAG: hypothetical protein K8J09_06165 [Planctomycetes bacterium]|nr:hypothetical protein [Planctomycetota bacterium]
MIRNPIFALAVASSFAASASAQFCSDNTYPARLVTAAGVELPTFFHAGTGQDTYLSPTENVYLAFDPSLPSGTYYVHVTDDPIDGLDEVLSQNDPMDRFVTVTNSSGVITLSLPFSQNPSAAVFGTGLGGQGQSLFLGPLATPTFSQCLFKVWYGDAWDLTNGPQNPYLLAGGLHPQTGSCAVRSYMPFQVGDGSGSDVRGVVFEDEDHSGARDQGEGGLGNWQVRLVAGTSELITTTAADGSFQFVGVAAGDYTVELTVKSGFNATTGSSQAITVCACGDVDVAAFGAVASQLPCHGRPISHWHHHRGLGHLLRCRVLPTLPALCLVDHRGRRVSPCNEEQLGNFLRNANTCNMAHMLSAELCALHTSVMAGEVHLDSVLHDPCLGRMTVRRLLELSIASLRNHPYTPVGSHARHGQSLIKNALDRCNNNRIWR